MRPGFFVVLSGLAAAGILVAGLCGCTTVATSAGSMPDDFALELSVMAPDGAVASGARTPVAAEHYVVGADGALRARKGGRQVVSEFPGLVRRLSTHEMSELWNLARAVPTSGEPSPFAPSEIVERPGRTFVFWTRGAGVESRSRFDNAPSPAVQALSARLAQWSWLSTATASAPGGSN